jgi:hypothetical protein
VRRLEITLDIAERGSTVRGFYRVDREGRMRIDVFSGEKRVYTEALDGGRAWQQAGEGAPVTEASAAGRATLWRGTQLPGQILGLHELSQRGHSVALAGQERVRGISYYVLRIRLSDGWTTYRYVHPATWRIELGRDDRALHVDADPRKRPIEVAWSDFRSAGGVVRAFRETQTDRSTAEVLQTTVLRAVRVNPPFPRGWASSPETASRSDGRPGHS